MLTVSAFLGCQILYGQAYGYTSGAQTYVERSEELLSRLRLNRNINALEGVSYESIEGNPFVFRDFVPGAMVLRNGETYPLNLRYDIYKNEIQFRLEGKTEVFAITNPEDIATLILDSLKFQNFGYSNSPDDKAAVGKAWFILKADGRCKLLIKKNMRLQDAQPAKPYQDPKPAKFILQSDSYYLKLQDGNAIKVSNKKDIFSILSDKSSELSKFIDSNKLNARDISDLVKIIEYYNTL